MVSCKGLILKLDTYSGGIVLQAPDKKPAHLHPIYLRERVIDPNNFDQQTRQRLYEPTDIDDGISIISAKIKSSNKLELFFSDGLNSLVSIPQILIELGWQEDHETMPKPISWTSNFQDWPRAMWKDLKNPKNLKYLLQEYFKYGFLLVENTPTKRNALQDIAKTFGRIRETNFGILFDVKTKIDPTDLADTSLALPAHTDNPYRNPIPGIQFLHCLHNDVKGGLATLVDGFAIVDELRRIAPEMSDILSTTQIRFRYESDNTIVQSYGSHIEFGPSGKLRCVRLSSRVDYVPPLDNETLSRFYAARKRMHQMANDPKFQINFTYEPGLLLMMDNTRLLHGRTAYDLEHGQRLLQGCYIDHDGPDSLYRKLSQDLFTLTADRKDG